MLSHIPYDTATLRREGQPPEAASAPTTHHGIAPTADTFPHGHLKPAPGCIVIYLKCVVLIIFRCGLVH